MRNLPDYSVFLLISLLLAFFSFFIISQIFELKKEIKRINRKLNQITRKKKINES